MSDFNNTSYQELVRRADHLDVLVDARQETFGGPLSNRVDPTRITSELWSAQSAEARFAEACRRYPALVDAWKTPGLLEEQAEAARLVEQARRQSRLDLGIPEGLV